MDSDNGLICANMLDGKGGSHPSGFAILISAQAALVVIVVLVFQWLRWL